MIEIITEADYKDRLAATQNGVLLFFKKLCPHCKNMEKVLEKFGAAKSGIALYGLPLDLILYALAMAGGFALAWHLQRARLPAWLCGVLVIAAGIYGAALALFSFAPPELPIFLPPV